MTAGPGAPAPAADVADKKAVGGIYPCQDCGQDYTARTVWQKRCPACREQVEKHHRRKHQQAA